MIFPIPDTFLDIYLIPIVFSSTFPNSTVSPTNFPEISKLETILQKRFKTGYFNFN